MCGRYNFSTEESAELREIVRQIESKNTQADWHAGEIFPTNTAPVLLWEQEHAELELVAWGFPGFKGGARTIINARAETAAERPMFRKSLDGRRCVVPTSGLRVCRRPAVLHRHDGGQRVHRGRSRPNAGCAAARKSGRLAWRPGRGRGDSARRPAPARAGGSLGADEIMVEEA